MWQSAMTVLMGLLINIALQFQPGKFDGLVQLGLQGFARRQQGEVVGHPDVALGSCSSSTCSSLFRCIG